MKRMLVVEDDPLIQKVFFRIFSKNHKIDACDSADEFYLKYSGNVYDIIIMDISLNGSKNGIELVYDLKANPRFSRTPIICLTASAQAKDRRTAVDSGIDIFLSKPVSIDVLKNSVEFLINKYQNFVPSRQKVENE